MKPKQQQLPFGPTWDKCQRWRNGRDSYRPAGEVIDTSRYGVDLLDEAKAKAYVIQHHYSHSYPAARVRVGLFRQDRFLRPELVGVAVFSVPMTQAAIPKYCGVAPAEGVELGRLVLHDDVPANGESWFLGRAFRLLAGTLPEVKAILAYADPVPRYLADGTVVLPGHAGTAYSSHHGSYFGRGSPRTLILSRDGRVVSERMLSKLRADDQGAGYAYRSLLALGAPRRAPIESGTAYVTRALREGPFVRMRHPGNHVYGWAIGGRLQRRWTERGFEEGLPYPKVKDLPFVIAA